LLLLLFLLLLLLSCPVCPGRRWT